MDISVVVPAFNEEARILDSLRNILRYLKNFSRYEIIVVDDGSTDLTVRLVRAIQDKHIRILSNRVNMGKGYSVRKGLLAARYSSVLFTDSDLATPIEELRGLLANLQKYDVVIASRNMARSVIKSAQPAYRRLMGRAFPLLVRLIALEGYADTQCGFKLFRRDAARRIARKLRLARFAFDVEMLVIAQQLDLKVLEAPVAWHDKKGSKVRLIADTLLMFLDLLRIRLNLLAGKYNAR